MGDGTGEGRGPSGGRGATSLSGGQSPWGWRLHARKGSPEGHGEVAPRPAPLPRLTAAHSRQRCLLFMMELKVSPQLLQPDLSLSRRVFEDPLLGSCYGRQTAAVSAGPLGEPTQHGRATGGQAVGRGRPALSPAVTG